MAMLKNYWVELKPQKQVEDPISLTSLLIFFSILWLGSVFAGQEAYSFSSGIKMFLDLHKDKCPG